MNKKVSEILNEVYGPILREQLKRDSYIMEKLFGKPSEEEMKAWREKRDAEEAFWNEQRFIIHKDNPVMQLHSKGTYGCDGCDFQGYDGEPPEWPCRTVRLICTGDADFVWGKK